MPEKSHFELIQDICKEAGILVEHRPKQRWGANYREGAVEYQVLRLGGNRCDLLFNAEGKLVSISQ